MNATSYGVTLLSGGLDSTTVTAYAKDRVEHLTAITFHYGQTHSKEVGCAQRIARLMGIQHKLVDISFLGEVAWYSALTHPDRFPIPRDRSAEEIGYGIPITYVPLRNTIFLGLSAAYLESKVLHAIEVEGLDPKAVSANLYMAPNAIDYSGYPDCRPEFFDQIKRTLRFGSKLWTQYEVPIGVETPIIELSKSEIVELAVRLKVPLEHTWSCYEGGDVPCGVCDSCILRARGFEQAGTLDPLLVRLGKA
jgi:7-cyano-7-deazaguanine synthase